VPQEFVVRDIVYPVIILTVGVLSALLFYWRLRRILTALADRTTTALDNLLIRSMEWPIIVGIILAGLYFAVVSLPFGASLDFEMRRAFHVAFLVLAGWAGAAALDAISRWYKLEVSPKTHTALDDWIVGLLRVFAPLTATFLVLVGSLSLFGLNAAPVISWLLVHGSRIGLIVLLSAAVIFVLGRALPSAVRSFVFRRAPGQPEEETIKRADTLSNVLVTSAQIFVIAVAAFMILAELDLNIAPILTGVGVAGIAIGFGAQTLVKDFLAGLFITMENQYRVGDVVTVAGISGLVEQIDLRRTILRDMDGVQHIVSNGEIRIASNFTKEVSRVNLNIRVSYGTDLDRAIEVINRVCRELAEDPNWAPMIVKTPEVLRVDNLGDSGIDLKILGETKPIRQWDVMGEIRKRIKKTFDEEGIEIPWPHTKVYFGNWPPFENGQHGAKGEEN
jgi:small-conductance mechanosensitive channel